MENHLYDIGPKTNLRLNAIYPSMTSPQSPSSNSQTPIRVFISYSWTSPEHQGWVKALASRLRAFGFETILDIWHLREGQDKYAFMESMATDLSIIKVVVVCDKDYARKADGRKSGVGVESTLISQEVYGKVDQQKFIPVVTQRGEDGVAHLTTFFKSRIYIDFSDETKFEDNLVALVRALADKPENIPPPIGKMPAFLREEHHPPANSPTTYRLSAAQNALASDKNTASGLVEDYLESLFNALEELVLEEERYDRQTLDQLLFDGLERWTPLRNEFVNLLQTMVRYSTSSRSFETLPRFFERALSLTADPLKSGHTDHIQFALYEAFLYAFAVFIKAERFDEAALLLSAYYRDTNSRLLQRFSIFLARLHRLESTFGQKSNVRQEFMLGYILQRRATHPQVSFEALQEPDLLLFLRYALETQLEFTPGMLSWTPYTWPYLSHDLETSFGYEGNYLLGLDFTRRARSRRYFESFRAVLGVDSKQELLQKWQLLIANGNGLVSFRGETNLDATKVQKVFEGFAVEA